MKLAAALVAAALATAARAESPRWGSLELEMGQYRPNVDAQPGLTSKPWETVFGTHRNWMFRAGLSWDVFRAFGSLQVGVESGYFQQSGFAQLIAGGPSGDTTAFKMIPTNALVTYRFDWLADRFGIPVAPYGRLGLERYNWWITDGAGHTSRSGATNGWSAAAGLCLLLDFFDSTLARELDQDTGINHTYVFAEARKAYVKDFGSSTSWDLSNDGVGYSFGILFVF